MRKRLAASVIVGMVLVFVLSVTPVAVLAEEGDDNATTTAAQEDKGARGEALKGRLRELKQQRQEARQERLADAKLRVCENRKAKITAIMERSIARAERQLSLFSIIAERVKTFYVDKGYNVTNYDELVAAVDAAKADAEANLETLKSLDTFECSAEDPKGDIEAFKLALHSINRDLKDYRTSVKNLIVGVKSAQSNRDGSEEGGEQ